MNTINRDNFPKITPSIIAGIVLILIGVIILVTDFLDSIVTSILWPILEGSSEGKTVLFLGILGSLLIICSIIRQSPWLQKKVYRFENNQRPYVASVIIILIICGLVGLLIEAYIRSQFGVGFFTILTSMDPNTSTTSPMHSHIYKSILGYLSYNFVPMHVNTASSILSYGLPYSLIIIPVWIFSYICGVIGISQMKTHRIVSLFALTLALIGILDGGIFSQPFLIGIFILLCTYYSNGEFSIRKLNIGVLNNAVIVMGYMLLVAMIIEVGGSDTELHTLTVINQTEPVDMSQFDVISTEVDGDKTIYTLNTTMPDKELIQEVFSTFQSKADLTFMSWNFYTYF
ncbi:MAG: hypothetical protein LUG89_00140 [Methanosphaera sp.]|nr:hypothetical protein [Methanosphaera sp.]